jgi:hypothetical protein
MTRVHDACLRDAVAHVAPPRPGPRPGPRPIAPLSKRSFVAAPLSKRSFVAGWSRAATGWRLCWDRGWGTEPGMST